MALKKNNRREFLKATGTAAASALLAGHVAAAETEKTKEVPLTSQHAKGRTLNAIDESKSQEKEFHVFERIFSDHDDYPSIGLANIHAIVPGIEANKERILRVL